VPENYNALELNEARINWFSASANYNQVVTEAADDAGGQGFVTEQRARRPRSPTRCGHPVSSRMAQLQNLTGAQAYNQAVGLYAQFDGFWDVVGEHVTLPPGTTIDQLRHAVLQP